jgi:hypothetical protein
LHLVTAEDPLTRQARAREWIRFPQLTMPLLAALTPEPWVVTHTDEIIHAVDTAQTYDLVGLTAATPGAPHAYALAQEFRARGNTVVMGGPHATLMPQEAAQHVDVVVVGEAETIWPRVLEDVVRELVYAPGRHTLDRVTGLTVEVLHNRARIYRCLSPASLDRLAHARRDLIRNGGWNKWWATRGAIIATRGCPHACDYCTIPLMYPEARSMRFRPVEEVLAEVAAIPDRGIVFWDDNLGANPQYAKALFRGLIPLKRWWTSQTTMASVRDDEVLELAARSGCKALFLGLESVSQASLAGAAKSHNRVSEYKRLLQRFHAHGIAVQAGTPAYARLSAEGRLVDHDWRHYNGKTHVVYRPRHMTPDELLAGYEWAKTQFYSPEHIFKRLNVSRTGLWWSIPRNLGYLQGLTGEVRARAEMHRPGES